MKEESKSAKTSTKKTGKAATAKKTAAAKSVKTKTTTKVAEKKVEEKKTKKGFKMPSAFTILLVIIAAIALVTLLVPEGSSVKPATLANVVMAPVSGFVDAIDVIIFVMVLGGFLGVVSKTKALESGIGRIVKKLKGKELIMIPILMTLFSLGGTTYGMAEETIAFYALIVTAMMAAGFDSLVGAAVILLGAGVGVLGSTVNPFAVGAAVDALNEAVPGFVANQTIIITLGALLWISSLLISIFFVMRYARKVRANKENTILTETEIKEAKEAFGKENNNETFELTGKRKLALVVFAIVFVVMIVSLIPWEDFGITIFKGTTNLLTGKPFGEWYFQELAAWFFIAAIVIGLLFRMKEKEIVDSFIDGAASMISVVLVIAVSRGISVVMSTTGLGDYILTNAAQMLKGINGIPFTIVSYLVFIGLSFLIPSTSGLAGASMPIMGGLAYQLGLSPEVMIMVFSAACGLVNLVTPTSGVVIGGLAVSKVEFSTWLKFVGKVLLTLFVVNLIILSMGMMLL